MSQVPSAVTVPKELQDHVKADIAPYKYWLAENGSRSESRWLVTYKNGDDRYLPYDRIVRVLIAHGCVDSQLAPI